MPPDPHIAPSSAGGPQFPGYASTTAAGQPNLLSLPIEVRFMIYEQHAKDNGLYIGKDANSRLANPACGVNFRVPAIAQVNKQIRDEWIKEYLQMIPWQICRSHEGLAAFRSWIKVLGPHARHLRRLRLTCCRGCVLQINIVPGEPYGYTHRCKFMSQVFKKPSGEKGYLDTTWADRYVEKQILVPLAKKVARGTLQGKHLVAAVDQVFVDIPVLFQYCWTVE